MLTYLQIHFYYTLPPAIILWFLLRPIIGQFDKLKIVILCAFALIYTTPWDNYIIYFKAWWYRKDAVIGTIGFVPIEEYLFFVIQTTLTSLWTILCTRWAMHSLLLRKPSSRMKFYGKRYVVLTALAILTSYGWFYGNPKSKMFYLGAIMWWILPVVACIWYIAGHFISQRWKPILLSILMPSIYLCYVDIIALRDGVWHINESTSLEILFFNDLPLEEIIFFFATNTVVVFGSMAFDKSKAILDTYFNDTTYRNVLRHSNSVKEKLLVTARYLMNGSLTDEIDLSMEVIDDIVSCIKILDKQSKSFSISANLFSNGNFIKKVNLLPS